MNIRTNEGCSIAVNTFGNCVLQTRVIFSLVLSCHIRVIIVQQMGHGVQYDNPLLLCGVWSSQMS